MTPPDHRADDGALTVARWSADARVRATRVRALLAGTGSAPLGRRRAAEHLAVAVDELGRLLGDPALTPATVVTLSNLRDRVDAHLLAAAHADHTMLAAHHRRLLLRAADLLATGVASVARDEVRDGAVTVDA